MKCLQEKWVWGNGFIHQFPTKWNLLRNQGGGDAIASHENLLAIIELGLECSRELPEERTDIKEVAVKLNKIKLKLAWSKHVSFKLVLVNFHALLVYACTLVILWMHYQLSNGFQLSNLWLVFLVDQRRPEKHVNGGGYQNGYATYPHFIPNTLEGTILQLLFHFHW